MIYRKRVAVLFTVLTIILLQSNAVLASYGGSETETPFSYGNDDTDGWGTGYASAAGDEEEGEARCYLDWSFGQGNAWGEICGYQNTDNQDRQWRVIVDFTLRYFATCGWFGFVTVRVYIILLNSEGGEEYKYQCYEALFDPGEEGGLQNINFEKIRTCPYEFDNIKYFGLRFHIYAGSGATVCRDENHTSNGYPAYCYVNSITWVDVMS